MDYLIDYSIDQTHSSDSERSSNKYIFIYIYIGGAFNKVPDFLYRNLKLM